MIRPSNRASIRNISDYSPFGVQLAERTISGDGYRYAFQGQENDDEIKGDGNSYDFGNRMYDPRVGRWMSVDKLADEFPSKSPYIFVSNNPIINIDPDGNADIYFNGKWIGNDGKDDNIIVVTTDRKIKREVKKATRKGTHYKEIGLSNGQKNDNFYAIDANVLSQSLKVLDKAFETAGTTQEHTAVMEEINGNFQTTFEGSSSTNNRITLSDGSVRLSGGSIIEGDVSIHSHPIGIRPDPTDPMSIYYSDAARPTNYDEDSGNGDTKVFEKFQINIIVGSVGEPGSDQDGNAIEDRQQAAVVFNNKSEEQFKIENKEGRKMRNSNNNNKRINKFHEKKSSH